MSPGRWAVRVALVVWLGLFLFVRLGDPFGDRGMSNVAAGLLLLIAALGVFVAVLARLPLRARSVVALAVLAASVAAAALVRIEGVSGETGQQPNRVQARRALDSFRDPDLKKYAQVLADTLPEAELGAAKSSDTSPKGQIGKPGDRPMSKSKASTDTRGGERET